MSPLRRKLDGELMFGFSVPVVKAEVFTAMPKHFRKRGTVTPWVTANSGGADIDSFLEGPSFDRAGNLYVTDIPFGRIFRISPAGEWALVAEYDGEPNGLKIHRDGRIFITDYRNGIMVLDPASGKVESFLGRRHSESFKGVNDLFFASNGDLYFTDQGQTGLQDPTGRVYRLSTAGKLDCLIDTVPSPNGLVMNPEENALFIAVTRGNCIWRGPLMKDGSLTKVGVFYQLYGPSGPDGLAMDVAGNLAVAHARSGNIWLFSKKGVPLLRVETCAGDINTNIAYGGVDNREIYITESETGTVMRARMPVAGRAMFSHQ
jgi:gluconolactonase